MAKTDPAHQKMYDMMAETAADPEKHKAWMEDFQNKFNAAPTV